MVLITKATAAYWIAARWLGLSRLAERCATWWNQKATEWSK